MTNTSFKLIFAALAATAALASCTKEPTPAQTDQTPASPASEGTRVIAVSFAPQTKTHLDTLQPKFIENDEILVCTVPTDKVDPEMDTCKVTFDDEDQPTITTKLTGKLNAYYPAKAAKLDKSNHLIRFTISNSQTGEFADANLCRAEIGENAEKATFINDYPLFIIYPPAGTKVLNICSLRDIENGAQRTGASAAINTDGKSDGEKLQIQIYDEGSDVPSPCYVVLNSMGNLKLSNLSFEAKTTPNSGAIKGIPTSKIAGEAGTTVGTKEYDKYNFVQIGTAYTIDDSNWHDYVTVAGRKWATMNIGASKPEDAGRYFAWGDTLGQVMDTISGTPFEIPYNWANAPFNNGSESYDETYFKSVMADVCPSGVLALKYDAANVNWGGAWRMPTGGELKYFEDYSQFVDEGIKSGDLLLPKTGCVEGIAMKSPAKPYCWSSSLDEGTNTVQPVVLDGDANKEQVNVTALHDRCCGVPIRAIIDEPADGDQEDAPQE